MTADLIRVARTPDGNIEAAHKSVRGLPVRVVVDSRTGELLLPVLLYPESRKGQEQLDELRPLIRAAREHVAR
jgi:hypothetical protein